MFKIHALKKRNGTLSKPGLLPWIEWAATALLAALLVWKGILPGWRALQTDFPNYYMVARLLREGYSLDRIYDWVWLQRIKDHWGIDQPLVGFAGLTPFSALPVALLSSFAALTAKRIWIGISLMLLVATVEALHAATSLNRRRLWLLFLLCVFPLRTSFLLGQMHGLVLALLAFAYALHSKSKALASGALLGVAGMLKIYPLLFAPYLAWKRQWATLLAMACTAALLLAVSTAWMGSTVMHTYLAEVMPRSLAGEVLDPYNLQSSSMAALCHRFFIYEPQLNPAPLANSPLFFAILYPAWQAVILGSFFMLTGSSKRDHGREQLEWAAWVFTLLLLSPVPASYHFVVMIFPMALLADYLLRRDEFKTAAVALLLYLTISLVELFPRRLLASGGPLAESGRLWVASGFWSVLMFCLWRARPKQKLLRLTTRTTMVLAGTVFFWASGALRYHHHFAELAEDAARRIPVRWPAAYLSTGLQTTSSGFLFTAMVTRGYQVLNQDGSAVLPSRGKDRDDQLSAFAAPASQDTLIEVAGASGSSLIATSSGDLAARVFQQGESAALFPGGTAVVFIRETRGRGSLWQAPSMSASGDAVLLTSSDYDVRHFTLTSSGKIVFAAKKGNDLFLFTLHEDNHRLEVIPGLIDVDFPAVSPGERYLAFTRNIDDRWQLHYLDTYTGQERSLTNGDCNAYAPQWMSSHRLAYATDCGRGLGLTALAAVPVDLPAAARP